MASDDSSGRRPAPVVLRIKLRYEDLDAMVHRFAPNVGKSGLFLPTKSVQPLGAEIKFELRLADDTPVLVGLGRVKAVKEPDPKNPKAAFGMAIELMRVTRESRDLILRMLERRREMGLAEVAIPMPADIEAARRSEVVDTSVSVRITASLAVPTPMPMVDSGPEALLTAPRLQSGPIAIAKMAAAIAPLGPEAPRRKRTAVSGIIESASGPISVSQLSVPGLDDDIDIGAVLVRARTLAGGNLDAELDALLEISAAPIEISIEAASAALARQLGGSAVDRSARWAPPPSTISAPIPAGVNAETAPLQAATPEGADHVAVSMTMSGSISVADVASGSAPAPEAPPQFAGAATHVDEIESSPAPIIVPATADQIITEPRHAAIESPMISDDADPDAFVTADSGRHEVDPAQIADEIHQLSEDDFEEVEHTQLGDIPVDPSAFDHHAFVTEPADRQEDLAQRLDAHLAQAEAEADADDLGMSAAAAPLEAATDDRAPDDPAGDPEPELDAGTVVGGAGEPLEDEDADLEEIDDFEILAEADADDADLLSSHGEQEASIRMVLPADPPLTSNSDFASRLDLGDDSARTPLPTHASRELSGRDASFAELDTRQGELDPRIVSAGHALAAFEDPNDAPRYREPSRFDDRRGYNLDHGDGIDRDSTFTLAENLAVAALDLDSAQAGFATPSDFDKSDIIDPPTVGPPHRSRAPFARRSVTPAPVEDHVGLENALEALDVDLDDLSIPHAPTELHRDRASSAAVRGTEPTRLVAARSSGRSATLRARSEDGVEIDFEDDDDL